MFDPFRDEIHRRFRAALLSLYGEPLPPLVWTQPPQVRLGDIASPIAFELAKRLKRAPAAIAAEIVGAVGKVPGLARIEVAAGGYLNLFLDRVAFLGAIFRQARDGVAPPAPADAGKRIIEHTNINPNKAARVGHLRNAVLGDTLGRAFRALGLPVEIQNYIDDTGVQVADVVVGLRRLRGIDTEHLETIGERLDTYLWDLYREVTERYEIEPDLVEERRRVLRDLESGDGENARLATAVADRIVRLHLATMDRIGVSYDLLPWEGDILAEKFWEKTFRRLRDSGATYRPEEGRHRDCWVIRIPDEEGGEDGEAAEKVLVRSDGTVTYIAKDIAYQLWKFGLLDADFSYRPFRDEKDGRVVWSTGRRSAGDPPRFGAGHTVYNVIDSRQARLQRIVATGLRVLGHPDEADRSIHFSYEMVTLSRACAAAMGIVDASADPDATSIEISGRKGQGIKADDLIDTLIERAETEVAKRNADFDAAETRRAASIIAIGALRYFMIRFNRNRVITFDFQDALSFEGDTGPYLQYSAVRAANILRKIEERAGRTVDELDRGFDDIDWAFLAEPDEGDPFWEIIYHGSQWRERLRSTVESLELSTLSRACFQLAQKFNGYYHRFPVLQEPDRGRQAARMVLVYLYGRMIRDALSTLGIDVPDRM